MSHLVVSLRRQAPDQRIRIASLMLVAADRIEHLEAALGRIANIPQGRILNQAVAVEAIATARAALDGAIHE